jgi:hypothetical protein
MPTTSFETGITPAESGTMSSDPVQPSGTGPCAESRLARGPRGSRPRPRLGAYRGVHTGVPPGGRTGRPPAHRRWATRRDVRRATPSGTKHGDPPRMMGGGRSYAGAGEFPDAPTGRSRRDRARDVVGDAHGLDWVRAVVGSRCVIVGLERPAPARLDTGHLGQTARRSCPRLSEILPRSRVPALPGAHRGDSVLSRTPRMRRGRLSPESGRHDRRGAVPPPDGPRRAP